MCKNAGESGKSTFLKQMRIIHGIKFDTEAIHEFQSIVYQNIIRGMRVLVDAREKLQIPWENPNNANLAPFLLRVDNVMQFDTKVFMEYAVYIQQLWCDHGIREAYNRRREFQLVSVPKFHHFSLFSL
jgi:guanine nucleotide-binding protein subunit alpha-12